MRPFVIGVVIAMGFAGSASAQAPTASPQPPAEQVVITPATEPRDGSWPLKEAQPDPAPKAQPDPAPAGPQATAPATSTPVPAPGITVPQGAAAPVRAQAPAAAAAPTSVPRPYADAKTSVPRPAAEAAAREGIAARRRAAVHRAAAAQARFADEQYAAGRRAENAIGVAIARAAAASPLDDASADPAPAAGRTVSAQAPAAPPRQTDLTALLLAIPLLFGAAALAHTHGGVRGRIRAFGRRPARTV